MENQSENQTSNITAINSQNERKNERNDVAKIAEVVTSEEVTKIDSYKSRIMTNWRKVVKGIIESGRILAGAEDNLSKSDMRKLLDNLPFSYSMAKKLMKIGRDQRLVRDNIIPLLPNSWGVVHKISTLPDDKFDEAVELGIINPGVRIPQLNHFLNPKLATLKNSTPYYSYGVVLIEKTYSDSETIDSVKNKIAESIKSIKGVKFCTIELKDILKEQLANEDKHFSTTKELIRECVPPALDVLNSFVEEFESKQGEIVDLESKNKWGKAVKEMTKIGMDKLSHDDIFHYLETFGLLGKAESFWHFYTSPINEMVLHPAAA